MKKVVLEEEGACRNDDDKNASRFPQLRCTQGSREEGKQVFGVSQMDCFRHLLHLGICFVFLFVIIVRHWADLFRFVTVLGCPGQNAVVMGNFS